MATIPHNYHRFLPTTPPSHSSDSLELHESDLFHSLTPPSSLSSSTIMNSTSKFNNISASSSMPINVPNWSKILKYEDNNRNNSGTSEELHDDKDGFVAPHEWLSMKMERTRRSVVCCSVHEGVGRTLKGRDLSRVRNAVWEITSGFQD